MSSTARDDDDRELTKEQLAVALTIDAFGIKAWRLAAPLPRRLRRTPADIRDLRKRGIQRGRVR
jgi:hypothetical protein